MWGSQEGMGWWMLFGGLGMVLFWGVLVGLIVWGIKQFTGGRIGSAIAGETPIEIAQKRLARGEISAEQFEELKKALQ